MEKNLLKLDKYCIFTFATTSHALKAEKVLKSLKADFIVMPTLREISSSCGLSVKVRVEDMDKSYNDLINNRVPVESVFQVEKEGKKNKVNKLELI